MSDVVRDSELAPISKLMIQIRESHGKNISQMARFLGVSPLIYGHFENANMRLSLTSLNIVIAKLKEKGYDVEEEAVSSFASNKKNLSMTQIPQEQRELMVLLARRDLPAEMLSTIKEMVESLKEVDPDLESNTNKVRRLTTGKDTVRATIADLDYEDNRPLNLGLRMKEIRHYLRVRQSDLSNFIGVSRSTISKMEMGTAIPQYRTLTKIIEYFKLRGLDTEEELNLLYDRTKGILRIPENMKSSQYVLMYYMAKLNFRKWELMDMQDMLEG